MLIANRMKIKVFLIFLLFGIAVANSFSQNASSSGPFSFSFFPGNTQETELLSSSGSSDAGPWQSLGGFNFGFRSPDSSDRGRWHSHVNVTEFQTLLSAGVSSLLYEKDSMLISGQALGGYALGHKEFADSWHGSFDLYAAIPLGPKEVNFLKYGAYIDIEEDFGKWGPQAALLLGADRPHPVTVDVAYGQGLGDEFSANGYVWSVAAHDVQMRAGIFLREDLQVGLTGQYQKWDDLSGTEEDWKTGGFMSWYSDKGAVFSIGAAAGEQGINGFASLSFTPGGSGSYSPIAGFRGGKGGKEVYRPDLPRTWMLSPVRRLQTVGVRQVENRDFATSQHQNTTMLGGSAFGTFFLFGDPFTQIGGNGDRLRVTYTNTTNFPQNVTIVSMESFDGTIFNPGVAGTVAPGNSLIAETPPANNAPAAVHVQTVVIEVNGQTFSLDFSFPGTVRNGFSTAPQSIP